MKRWFEHRGTGRQGLKESSSRGKSEGEATGKKRGRITLLIGLAVALAVAIAFLLDAFLVLELKSLDARYRIRGEVGSPEDVVIVGIDDDSFRQMQLQWPWPRAVHAELIDALADAGASVVAFDVLFLEPSRLGPEDDARLAEAATRAGNVIFGHKLTHIVDRNFRTSVLDRPIGELTQAAWTLGLVNHPPDPDRFARRSYLYANHQSQFQPSLSLAAVAAHLGIPIEIFAFDATSGVTSLPLGEHHIGVLPQGPFAGTYFINFLGGARTVRTIPYYQVLEGMVPPEWLEGKIVLVGVLTPDLDDLFATPFFHQGLMPGVEVHANAVVTLLNGNPLQLPAPAITLLVIIVGVMATAWFCGRASAFKGFLAAVGMIGLLVVASIWTFSAWNIWIQAVPPAVGIVFAYTLVNAYRFTVEERERRRVHNVFGRYVSKDVVDQILATEGEIPLGGTRQEATLLFSDIRGFTSMSESMEPEEVVTLLNEYFQVMTRIILQHRGTIDKFMGDAIMAIFGAPLPREDDAARCVRTAVDMRKALEDLQMKWEAEGKPRFDTGIGINTGEVLVGNIGSQERLEYTAIGDDVNLASRLEGLTKDYGGGILIAEGTYRYVKDLVEVQRLDPVLVKGKAMPVQIYKVLGLKDDPWRDSPAPGLPHSHSGEA